jgi:hypothetical protein
MSTMSTEILQHTRPRHLRFLGMSNKLKRRAIFRPIIDSRNHRDCTRPCAYSVPRHSDHPTVPMRQAPFCARISVPCTPTASLHSRNRLGFKLYTFNEPPFPHQQISTGHINLRSSALSPSVDLAASRRSIFNSCTTSCRFVHREEILACIRSYWQRR